jgi:hypothetical protein
MIITVHRVSIPAWSTIGYGFGRGEDGQAYEFVGDHRPMRDIGEAIAAARSDEELPTVDSDEVSALSPSGEGASGE